jgi:ThiF family
MASPELLRYALIATAPFVAILTGVALRFGSHRGMLRLAEVSWWSLLMCVPLEALTYLYSAWELKGEHLFSLDELPTLVVMLSAWAIRSCRPVVTSRCCFPHPQISSVATFLKSHVCGNYGWWTSDKKFSFTYGIRLKLESIGGIVRSMNPLARSALAVSAAVVAAYVAWRVLARAGCKRILAIEYDRVKHANLNRILYATREDAEYHRPKAEVLKRGIDSLSLGCEVIPVVGSVLDAEMLKRLNEADFIFGCVDKDYGSLEKHGVVFINAALMGLLGDVDRTPALLRMNSIR